MVMPLCGTFHYAGDVPALRGLKPARWTCEDRSGAPVGPSDGFSRLSDNRLVGLRPVLRISSGQLVLQAASRDRAQVSSASIELDRALLKSLHTADRIELVRTGTADIGVALRRAGELLWAVGAVTTVSLGPRLQARGGHRADAPDAWPRRDTWVEFTVDGHTARLHDGEDETVGDYRVTLVRAFKDGIPGRYETAAISHNGSGLHDATLRAARILGGSNRGLRMTSW